jgi:hypothetical protein
MTVLALAAVARSDDAGRPVSVTAKVDKKTVTVGDKIVYTVSAVYEKGFHVEFESPGANLGEFEIRDFSKKGPLNLPDGGLVLINEYTIAAYSTGKLEIPAVQIVYWKRRDEKATLKTKIIGINVKQVIGKNAKDIIDIKEPLAVPFPYLIYVISVSAALFLIGIGVFIFIKLRRRAIERAKNVPDIPIRREHAHMAAFRELDDAAAFLADETKIKEFYIGVSEAIRRYISGRFGVPTMERTTDEIMSGLFDLNLRREYTDLIGSLLRDADMVKFAKVRPVCAAREDDLARARKIVESTMERAA